MRKARKNIVLAIETAFEGGSLSLFDGKNEIDSWTGIKAVSKADHVLEEISKLLRKNKIEKKYINSVVVSKGPGSSTGIKIGLAIAKGLGTAIGCKIVEISALEALTETVNLKVTDKIITVLPVGKKLLCWQFFNEEISELKIESEISPARTVEEFSNQLKSDKFNWIIFHQDVPDIFQNLFNSNEGIKKRSIISTDNLASLMRKRTI